MNGSGQNRSTHRKRKAREVPQGVRCLGLLTLGLLGSCLWATSAFGQAGRPLVDHYALKLGASQAQSFINVTRKSDSAQTSLVTGDRSPYVGFDTPPWFLGNSIFSIGISTTYEQFSASQQQFPNNTQKSLPTQAKVRTLFITPTLSFYLGRASSTQYLRVLAGAGIGWAKVDGQVEFGATPGLEPPETLQSPSGVSPAVKMGIEYRYRMLSIAYYAGGPLIEGDRHTYQLGSNAKVLSLVFGF